MFFDAPPLCIPVYHRYHQALLLVCSFLFLSYFCFVASLPASYMYIHIHLDCDETLSGDNDGGYRGCQTKTNSGATCQRWDSQTPNKHTSNTPATDPDSDLSYNYCRNPDGEETIWCYTMDGERWEYCTPRGDKMKTGASLGASH